MKRISKINIIIHMTKRKDEKKRFPEVTLKQLMEEMKMPKSDYEKRKEREAQRERLAKRREKVNKCKEFLKTKTPEKIEKELSEYVVGQPELVKEVASFLYYHVIRQIHTQLPVRNLLVAGSSGSGKTEVFRCVKELYGDTVNVKIADGSRITKEGWTGSQKLEGLLTEDLDILVVDEMDKLCTPSYTAGGANVSKELQSEFLKLLEGEFEVKNRKESYVLEGLSVVMTGAFEVIREEKKRESNYTMGFATAEPKTKELNNEISDEELIKFGVMPELLGRISVKVVTNDLTNEDYLQILKNPHGRVSRLLDVLKVCGVEATQVLSDEEILDLISKSKNNRTGFRWVSAQVENRILEAVRTIGVVVQDEEEKEEILEMNDDDVYDPSWDDDDFFF